MLKYKTIHHKNMTFVFRVVTLKASKQATNIYFYKSVPASQTGKL